MEYARSAFARPAPTLALARTSLPRVAPSTIASIAMDDLRPENMACSGIREASAPRIIAQWAAWRRQACEQMLHDLDRRDRDSEALALASLQAVSTMIDASILHQPRLYGWEARRHVVVTRELQGLAEHRAVSAFVHRECIESFFRRILYFSDVHDEVGSVSMATRELGELRESHPVTDDQATNSTDIERHSSLTDQVLRDDNHHFENATSNHEIHTFHPREDQYVNVQSTAPNTNYASQDGIYLEGSESGSRNRYADEYSHSGSPEQGSEQSAGSSSSSPTDNSARQEEAETYGQPNEGECGAFVDGDDEQTPVGSPQWQPADERFYHSTYNNFLGHPVDGIYGVVLPDILTRHNVPNLLSSSLRANLDHQLIQSYAQRQEFGERQMPNTPVSVDEDHAEGGINEPSQAGHDTANNVREEAGTYGQQNEGEGGAFVDGDDEQHAVDSPQWQPDDESFYRPTYNNFLGHPVDGIYGLDLQELLTRHSFSNILSSGFGESPDQQPVERQRPNTPASVNEDDAEHGINEPNQARHDTAGQPSFVFTGQGRRRRQWYSTHPEFLIGTIQELQVDMAGLYLRMKSMHQMQRACIDMHIELQRSIKQEVSAALNRSRGVQGCAEGQVDDASRWRLVRKGTCCVCMDNQIDSLLYRCGHMCTCSKCARELLNGDGKCPMCRAPIVEVVRAYPT